MHEEKAGEVDLGVLVPQEVVPDLSLDQVLVAAAVGHKERSKTKMFILIR